MRHAPTRRLQDLISVGPAMLRDFELLKVRSISQLARQDPRKMYEKLCHITGQRIDVCCLDTFQAAVAQARNPAAARRKMPVVVLEPPPKGKPCQKISGPL